MTPDPGTRRVAFRGKAFWITVLAAFLLAVAFAYWNGVWNR